MYQRWMGILSAVLLLSGLSACQQKTNAGMPVEQAPVSAEVQESQHLLGSSGEVVMSSDDLKLTMGEYERCIEVHRLMGRPYSKRALANPRFQRDEAQRCFQSKFIREYLKKAGVSSAASDRERLLKAAMERESVQSEQALAEKLQIKPELLAPDVEDALLPLTLQKALISQMPDVEMRKLFDVDFRRYTLELVEFENQLTAAEVDKFLAEKQDVFSNYLGAHQELLKSPPSARFIRMGYTQSGGEEDFTAQKAAEALRLTAIQKGADAALEACRTDKARGCVVLNDKDNLYSEYRNAKNVWAFRSVVGTVSELIQTPVMDEIWILQSIVPPEPLDIHHPETRHELGRKVMSALEPAPHLIEAIRPELESANPDFKATADKHGGKYQRFDETYYLDLVEKKLISSPRVMEVLAEMRPEESRLFSNPIVDNGRVYIFYVNRLSMPSDADFEAQKEAWKARRMADPGVEIANEWIQKNMPRMTSLNIKPIQNIYGILQPNGVIR